jgi:hypothetical protein
MSAGKLPSQCTCVLLRDHDWCKRMQLADCHGVPKTTQIDFIDQQEIQLRPDRKLNAFRRRLHVVGLLFRFSDHADTPNLDLLFLLLVFVPWYQCPDWFSCFLNRINPKLDHRKKSKNN